ncbi:hypothetical protein RHGRI_027611 [Rhododendron griersonianum]|uniref:Uncharacterized protein n=1 Tax=Rhododendron griersonianum TaxID=479676 RepID=A0AAV6IX99_9ERIC|nr:hypothetical protein RHGRI_027611 [Rhododendron griersonianum]
MPSPGNVPLLISGNSIAMGPSPHPLSKQPLQYSIEIRLVMLWISTAARIR